ncbi:toprim domain-containing protein [Planctomycetota bacterium]|nr:toprim domain-containing protein [Planctomycetota bacterium]
MSYQQFPSNGSEFVRVGRGNPCPICGKPDWCSVSSDGQVCICMRVSEGCVLETRNNGFLHKLTSGTDTDTTSFVPPVVMRKAVEPEIHSNEWRSFSQLYHLKAKEIGLYKLSDNLGVSVRSLEQLEAGWNNKQAAWTFPMMRDSSAYSGIRLRNDHGKKWAIKGSKQGLFIPKQLRSPAEPVQTLLIAEGPTDTAALLDLGAAAIGRPSCSGGTAQLLAYVQQLKPAQLVIASDHDKPGQQGAAALAKQLASHGYATLVVTPPAAHKDMRAWLRVGATANDLANLISAKPSHSVAVELGGAA